jgi:hypothetical protein
MVSFGDAWTSASFASEIHKKVLVSESFLVMLVQTSLKQVHKFQHTFYGMRISLGDGGRLQQH